MHRVASHICTRVHLWEGLERIPPIDCREYPKPQGSVLSSKGFKTAQDLINTVITLMADSKVEPSQQTHVLMLRHWLNLRLLEGFVAVVEDMEAAKHDVPNTLLQRAYNAAREVRN